MTVAGRAWAQVLARFGRPSRPRKGPDGEQLWLGPSDRQSIDVLLPGRLSFLVVCPKRQPISWWFNGGSLPEDAAVFCAPCPTDPRALPVLGALSRVVPSAVFVGDMDPFAIVQFLEAKRMLGKARGSSLLYGGIDDAWLGAMERTLIRHKGLDVRISLSKHEIRLLGAVERAIDLEQLVGRRCCSLLRSGYKIELEGATNPKLYPRSHGRWVFSHLRALVAERVRERTSASRRDVGTHCPSCPAPPSSRPHHAPVS